jgi:lysozyme family protein
MSQAAFNDALPFVLRWEGGFVNHPADPGGATNRGITQKVYDGFRQGRGLAVRSVRELEDEEMRAIYQGQYWVPPRCDDLMTPLDFVQFDTAVNMGVSRAVKFLQQAVGAEPDGQFGRQTKECVAGCDAGKALVDYCQVREDFYRRLAQRKPEMAVFLTGWLNRLNALRKQVGLPGFESAADEVDFGDAGYMAKVPEFD